MIATRGTLYTKFKIGNTTIYTGTDDPNSTSPAVTTVLQNSDLYIRNITSVGNVGPQIWIYDKFSTPAKWTTVGSTTNANNRIGLYFEKDIPAGFPVTIGETVLNYDVVRSYNNGEFNYSTGSFIPQYTGLYSFQITLSVESSTAIDPSIGITVNGSADFKYGFAQCHVNAGLTTTMTIVNSIPINALDDVKLVFRNANTLTKYFGTYSIVRLG